MVYWPPSAPPRQALPLIGFYVDTLSPLWGSVPLTLHACAELLAGGEFTGLQGDMLLITYKEQLAFPENTSGKWGSALHWPQVSLCQGALEPEMKVRLLLSVGRSCWLARLVYSYCSIGACCLAPFCFYKYCHVHPDPLLCLLLQRWL